MKRAKVLKGTKLRTGDLFVETRVFRVVESVSSYVQVDVIASHDPSEVGKVWACWEDDENFLVVSRGKK